MPGKFWDQDNIRARMPKLLIEGHIFSELPFSGNITTIYLDAAAHSEIHNNAGTFAAEHGAKLVVDKIS
jgi:hypothetical protein